MAAVFPLRGGGAVCLQVQDAGDLPRGGVYLLGEDLAEVPAVAPRFDELFADACAKGRVPAQRDALRGLLREAGEVAQQTRPQLTPEVLGRLEALLERAAELDGGEVAGVFRVEELVASAALIFVSEEERYPRPRYQGCGMALGRFAEALGEGA